MVSAIEVKDELFASAVPGKREVLSSFFKTGVGEYGEGDVFLGVPVPTQRALVKEFGGEMDLDELHVLLGEEFHECRMTALLFLVRMFEKCKSEELRKVYFDFYIHHIDCINNWDLVDLSAPQIVGGHLKDKERSLLYEWADSQHLWKQRVAMVSTVTFIRNDEFEDAMRIADKLLSTKESLLQKATGWMLREVGKKDYQVEYDYLKKHYKEMSRTTLRYAIERFDESVRKSFLRGEL